jgi:hypothetical protein
MLLVWTQNEFIAAVVVFGGFGVVVVMIAVNIALAARDAARFEKAAHALFKEGRCPCCGENIEGVEGTNCPHCKNWIAGYRRHAGLK